MGGRLGYQQEDQRGPALLRWLFHRLHRQTHVVEWGEVRAVRDGTVRLTASGT